MASKPAQRRRLGGAQRRVALVGLGALGAALAVVAAVAFGLMLDSDVDPEGSSAKAAATGDASHAAVQSASAVATLPVRAGPATPAGAVRSTEAAQVTDPIGLGTPTFRPGGFCTVGKRGACNGLRAPRLS